MIPKRIFYVWGVNDPKKRDVLACIQSWRQSCPDYEIIEINEDSKDYFDFQHELQTNKWFSTVYNRQMWAYVADYIRIKVLYNHGGIYLDTDVSVLKSFNKFLKDKAFVGIQDSKLDGYDDLVEPAILGAQKGNRLFGKICDFYDSEVWCQPIFTMPQIFKHYLSLLKCPAFPARGNQSIIKLDDIVIYPEEVFIPFRYNTVFDPKCVTDETYTIHWWGGSWVKPEVLYFLQHKHLGNVNDCVAGDVWLRRSYSIYKLFGFLPISKICHQTFGDKIIKTTLFFGIRIVNITSNDISRISLFGFVPLLKIKDNATRRKVYLFNILPVYVIKRNLDA